MGNRVWKCWVIASSLAACANTPARGGTRSSTPTSRSSGAPATGLHILLRAVILAFGDSGHWGATGLIAGSARRRASPVTTHLALGVVLFATLGMEAIHPWLHSHAPALVPQFLHAFVSGELPQAHAGAPVVAPHDPCLICRFLATYHSDSRSVQSPHLASAPFAAGLILPASPFIMQLACRCTGARSPPF